MVSYVVYMGKNVLLGVVGMLHRIQTVAVARDLLREACTAVCVGIIALGEIEPIRKSTLVSELCQTVLL